MSKNYIDPYNPAPNKPNFGGQARDNFLAFAIKKEEERIADLETTKEDISNKVTSLSDRSTNIQYPSAKAVVDYVATESGKIDSISIDGVAQPIVNKNVDLPAYPTRESLNIDNVDNTSDLDKPISTATQAALDLKAADSAVVHNTGDETISGNKTFEGNLSVQRDFSALDSYIGRIFTSEIVSEDGYLDISNIGSDADSTIKLQHAEEKSENGIISRTRGSTKINSRYDITLNADSENEEEEHGDIKLFEDNYTGEGQAKYKGHELATKTDLEPLDERITNVEKQVRVYNYFYADNHNETYLPLEDTKFTFLELSSKGIPDNEYYAFIGSQGDEPYIPGEDNLINTNTEYYLYQTGLKSDITTSKYAYDTFDFKTQKIIRYCYPISFANFFALFSNTDFDWDGTKANGRLTIRHTTLASKGIYTENGFVIKLSQDIGLTCKGISTVNFAFDNLKSIPGITNRDSAISVLSGQDYGDIILVFKKTEPTEEETQIDIITPEVRCDGIHQIQINDFGGCIKASYLSLYTLVYSKDQADAKFQTIAKYVEDYESNDHIIKIGDLTDTQTPNKILATSAIYDRLREMGWPKVASAFCVAPGQEEEYSGELIPEFVNDTLFINSYDGTSYGYIVLSNKNMYWFRVDSRTSELTLESMLDKEISYNDLLDKPRANDNIMNSDNDSLVQVSHFNEGLTWSSDDESVATVDQEGKITAVGAGTATISVIDEDGRTAECQVTVTAPTRQLSSRKGLLRGVAPQGTQYKLVSDVSNLSDGDSIIIAAMKSADNSWYALSTAQNSNNRAVAAISTPTDDIITITGTNVEEITLESTGQSNQFNLGVSGGYLYAASSSSNYLRTRSDIGSDGNANWLLDIINNEASIVAQGNYTRNTLRAYLSGSNPVFSCYAGASNVPVRIYKKVEGPEPPESVTITGTSGTLTVGTSAQLSASVTPVTASQEVTWSTSDSSIINVDSTGYITAEGVVGDSADITATCVADTSITATVTIVITEVPTVITAVNVTPSTVSGLTYGETSQLSAEVVGTGPGVTQDVTWTSGDEDMATVDSNGLVTIGNKPGNVAIIATSDVDPNVSGSSIVTVPQAMVTSIEIDPTTPTEITVGLDSDPINYNIYPSYAYDKRVEWSSSDTSKATVTDGVVSALEITSEPVVITVSALDGSGESDSIEINVVAPLGSLYLDVEELTLTVGETYKLICSDRPFNVAIGKTSAAFGYGNDVEHEASFAFGSHLTTAANNQVLVGSYNDAASSAVFAVGAGNAENGFNAFEVSSSGKAISGSATTNADSDNTLTTKGYVDEKTEVLSYSETLDILTSAIMPEGTTVENNSASFPEGVTVNNHNINL